MNINTLLNDGVKFALNSGGINTTIKLIDYSFFDEDYDDQKIQTVTGSNTISGLIFPLSNKQGSEDALLMQQGKLLTKDKVLYTGSVNISGNILIQSGSDYYTIIPEGIHSWSSAGSTIFNKFYIRYTVPGSLF